MERKRIAIACQGGGSQCAFVAGALKTLLARGVQERFRIVGLSGTSGGALTAALAWDGLLLQARGDRTPVGDRIIACWRDLTAQTPREVLLDGFCTQLVRLAEHGLLPTVASSPSSLQFQLWSRVTSSMIGRPEFTDFRALITKHIDFDALPPLIEAQSPTLLLGAGDVLEGRFKIFSSARGEISAEAVLASAAIPNLFPAVWVEGHAYWDGIFASNPPVISFLREPLMGKGKVPDEIWIIQVNRSQREGVPEAPSEISDRRNDLAGNLSLQHELEVIDMVNLLLQEGALTPEFRARFGFDATERITVRFIRMSQTLQENLDYPSKLSRLPAHIDRLIANGEAQATAFLSELDGFGPPPANPLPNGDGAGPPRVPVDRPS
ncbi:MAG TPA: patatin-like phospholipase family protein [Polyangia bacterium]|nr:patatin-like phospholipase family protein [Polyangia bacterium]